MDHFENLIRSIANDQDYNQQFTMIDQIIVDNSGTNSLKPQTKQLLDAMTKLTEHPAVSPMTKLRALLLAKDFTEKRYMNFVSALSSSVLLQRMLDIGRTVDPSRPIEGKGLNYFPDPKLGNHYIRLVLECIVKWGNRFPMNSNNQPTKFRQAYQQLCAERVVLPEEFIFFASDSGRKEPPPPTSPNNLQSSQSRPPKVDPRYIQNNLKSSLNKIEGFMDLLEHPSNTPELEMDIGRYHRQFQDNGRYLENNYDEVMSTLSHELAEIYMGIIQFYVAEKHANSHYIETYHDLQGYSTHMLKEGLPLTKHFQPGVTNSQLMVTSQSPPRIIPGGQPAGRTGSPPPLTRLADYPTTASGIISAQAPPIIPGIQRDSFGSLRGSRINDLRDSRLNSPKHNLNHAVEKLADMGAHPPPHNNQAIPKPTSLIQPNDNLPQLRVTSPSTAPIPLKTVLIVQRQVAPPVIHDPRDTFQPAPPTITAPSAQVISDPRLASQSRTNAHIDNLVASTVNRGIAPASLGFKSILNDFQREKAPVSKNKLSKSPKGSRLANRFLSTSKSREKREEFVSDLSSNALKMSVFDLHPNALPPRRDYFGKLVPTGIDYYNQLKEMSRGQNLRRFKTSNFKDKSLVLEDDHLQVGFKSKPIYEMQEGHLRIFLRITLFFGNKGDEKLSNVEIEYEGDETFKLYGNPRKLQPTTEPGYQTKQELMLVPMAAPFNLVSMNLGYLTTDGLYCRYKMFLPTSLIKFVQFKRIAADNFERLWEQYKQSNSIYCTAPNKLARNFPPLAVKYYMRALTDLDDYYEFLAQKTEEHKACCVAVLMLHEDYLLKLHIRADMSFVWRVAVPTNTPEAIAHGRFLVQTLQFLFSQEY